MSVAKNLVITADRLCGIGDEAAPDLAGQLAIHHELGMDAIELRTVDGLGLHELEAGDAADLARRTIVAGLRVPVVDTPVGSWSTTVATPMDDELAALERSAKAAALLGCDRLRVMSYPGDGRPEREWRTESLRRMKALAREAEQLGVTLLHENCQGWAGQSAAHTVRMLEEVASPRLRLLFDTGNGLAYGYDSLDFLRGVLPWVEHVHIKDGVRSGREAEFTMPGEGTAHVAECVALLEHHGYRGFYSLEPHLARIPHLGLAGDPAALADGYREYTRRCTALLGIDTTDSRAFIESTDSPMYWEGSHHG
ncbi:MULTISPECIES: sugar phosphate isomerase/epimerase family protein [unclassified Streptomyces]|uniref:sugar phosphate isomerase/epimerase family protein n=1 Tax=unclassified Streptomyces TaxID=2593676 RepID=UPI002E0FC5A5|nr:MULTISPECIES: sugar phosphate isomerase/epimerase family protein [unclassified Streptomyces]WSJ23357.1 sugar phosphate isomerase/epimerase [Streptomyces sp. NBC_01324]